MGLQQRVYSVLIVSASQQFTAALEAVLPRPVFSLVQAVTNISAAKRAVTQQEYDFVLVNSPLPDDPGLRFAMDVSGSGCTVALVFVRSELHDQVYDRVMAHGVFTLPKPAPRQLITQALYWMESAREGLRRFEKKTLSLEEKMAEIRLINRAKWLLISSRGMEEPEAHRYLEKQAMDRCVSKRVIAQEIVASAQPFEP